MEKRTAIIGGIAGVVIITAVFFGIGCIAPPEEVPTLTVAYLPSDHHAALFVAGDYWEDFKDAGVYIKPIIEKERYEFYADDKKIADFKIVLAKQGGAQAMTMLAQGHSDINLNGAPPTILFIDQGVEAKIVSPLQSEGSAVVVGKDNPANNWQEFVDWIKTNEGREDIGFPLAASIQKVMLEYALKASNITYTEDRMVDADVLIWDMKGQGAMPGSLDRGDIDAFIAWQPTPAIVVEEQGIGKIIVYSQDLPPEGVWKGHLCCVVVASDKTIKENEEVLVKFLELIMLANDKVNENPELGAEASANWLGVSKDVESKAIPTIKFTTEITDTWLEGSYKFVDAMNELGKLEGKLKDVVDREQIDSVLFDFGPYNKAMEERGK